MPGSRLDSRRLPWPSPPCYTPTIKERRGTLKCKECLTHAIMVEVATVSSKGQVTLPASIRKKLGLRKGSKVIFLEAGKEVRLLTGQDLEKRFTIFERRAKELNLTPERLSALVKEAKERLWKEHYAGRH